MSRKVTSRTKLGRLILSCGKPAYVVAAEVGMAYSQLSRYINRFEPISPKHLRRLADYFDVEPEDVYGTVDSDPIGARTPEVDG